MTDEPNRVYKDLKRTLQVTADSQEARMVDLKGTFSSYDTNAARLVFSLVKDSVPFPLASLTANVYLKAPGLHVQYACTIDKTLSEVTYILSEEVLQTRGVILGELYLNYNQGQHLSAHQFTFKIEQALIDQDLEYIDHVYINDLEDIKETYVDGFEHLKLELESSVADLQTQTTHLDTQLNAMQATLDGMDMLKKSGDTATNTIQFGGDTAISVVSNYVKHYIGAQTNGTIVRVYFNETWGDTFTEYLDVVVGGEEVTSSDGRFILSALTSASPYVTGYAPPGYLNTKTEIGGIEKAAHNTITYKSMWDIKRNKQAITLQGDTNTSGTWVFDTVPLVGAAQLETATASQQRATNTLSASKNYVDSIAPVKEIVWEGDNSGMLTTPQTLVKAITNYDFVHIQFKNLGIAQYDVTDCQDNKAIIITRSDTADSGTSATQYLRRLKFQFQNNGTEFVGLSAFWAYGTTIQNATDVGILRIVGIKLKKEAT
ncbi:BppU family phage baseplate upper protein [Listeria sp. FSL L7-1582]|uniref:BppU family phage baseplate upper protein n=1 Tax=Listeria portnoyi TaxID=2713504 RepID=UPI00164DEF6B|nr:BppU family phage baseplate upper protein [Listeria portnoyi]MBC6310156.1 BppU family phage baseplate upper protein [Listeria portnoyi]